MSLSKEEHLTKRIDVLLNEYQACHRNRNHYDSIRWTIASIFMATSFTMLGISFTDKVQSNILSVGVLASFSIFIFLLWYAINSHIQPWITKSIERFWEIEDELEELDFDINLHRAIRDYDEIRKKGKRDPRRLWIKTGRGMAYLILVTGIGAWLLRLLLFLPLLFLPVN